MKNQNGITLIALVITILVLMILTGVAINLTLGDNGILRKAETAKENYNLAREKEALEIEIMEVQVEILETEGRNATLNDLQNKIDTSKYTIELHFESIATTQNVNTVPTYAIVNRINTMYYFTVDAKLVITDVELAEPARKYINFSEVTWENGKASITLSTTETGTIEYKIGEDGTYQEGTTIGNLNHADVVYARINNNGEYTEEETKIIYDGIEPEEFEITVPEDSITYEAIKLSTTGTIDNQTGLATYSYVAATSSSEIVQRIENQTVTEYTITGLSPETEYVVYVLAYDNAGNVRKSNEVKVKTLPRTINAQIILQNPSRYLGKIVTNYINGDEYMIFDSDGTNIYLVSRNVKELGSPANKYGGSNGITCSNILADQTVSADSGNWKSYFGKNALWVQGSPTIQQLASSYQKIYPNKYMEYREGGTGYQVKWSDVEDGWANYLQNIESNELYTCDKNSAYWVSSPGGDRADAVMTVYAYRNYLSTTVISATYHEGYYWGFRPYVCMNSNTTLKIQDDGSVIID